MAFDGKTAALHGTATAHSKGNAQNAFTAVARFGELRNDLSGSPARKAAADALFSYGIWQKQHSRFGGDVQLGHGISAQLGRNAAVPRDGAERVTVTVMKWERQGIFMNGTSSADIFLEQLKHDFDEYQSMETDGFSMAEKKNAIRSLMNIRIPLETSEALLAAQDHYLQEELAQKGVVALADIPTIKEQFGSTVPFADKLCLWQGDITRLKAGAIVNAANSQMLGCFVPCHRCIDNAIHSAAGMQLRAECHQIMQEKKIRYGKQYEEPTGTAICTRAYNLPCDYVIHTVGPIVYGGLEESHCQDLRNCYESVLNCCLENGISSVAFCCISTGEFHFPNAEATEIAVRTVTEFLRAQTGVEKVVFNVFKREDYEIYRAVLGGGYIG